MVHPSGSETERGYSGRARIPSGRCDRAARSLSRFRGRGRRPLVDSIVIGQAILLVTAAGAAFWVPEISLPRSAERPLGRAAHNAGNAHLPVTAEDGKRRR